MFKPREQDLKKREQGEKKPDIKFEKGGLLVAKSAKESV
jgi:hypothetical protein